MSYIINNSRGNIIAVVADGTVNTNATSLTLVGRGVTSYGEAENENYLYLLENFAKSTAPLRPILGQLWYNSDSDTIATYNAANTWTTLASQTYVEAQKISPVFSGTPTAPTASAATNTTQLATTEFVQLQKASPAFTGVPTAPTPIRTVSTNQLATTEFVQINKISPDFTGTPTAPTAPAGTANTQIATTEFVLEATGYLGSMSHQDSNSVSITGGNISGLGTPLALTDGGTGAYTQGGARQNLGLGSMAYLRELTKEPLLKQLLRNVMTDEARHISFGVITLKEVYAQMTDAEIMERQEFAYEASVKVGERVLQQEVYEKMGVKTKDIAPFLLNDPAQAWIRKMLAAKIVPNVSKLGLLDRNGAWLRRKFEEAGTIEFENLGESDEEFSAWVHTF